MGKKEMNKPEITVEAFNRAIRTYQREDENVCDTLFTLACQCGCVGMLRSLMEQHKAEKRYTELGSYSLDILKTIKDVPSGALSSDDLR